MASTKSAAATATKVTTKAPQKELPLTTKVVAKPTEEKKEVFFNLQGRIWTPELLENIKVGKNQAGNKKISFSASLSRYDDRAGKYISGKLINFIATDNGYGNLATAILDAHGNNERLIEMKAQFNAWEYQGSYYENYQIVEFSVVERPQQ
ncbi:MAG: hypothetical protein CMB76_05185 [Euryarchaeota archaeon]|nr:hypothetical protein [Euryarchaeota archaeon]|tara:strand:+ start:1322 stop:1774 length:453 start_codon:yes stop_codon:yes gene_type:complete